MKTLFILFVTFLMFQVKAQVQSKPSDKFVDMIGVCTHFSRSHSAYTNFEGDTLREKTAIGVATNIRIRHLRDGVYGWSGGTEDKDVKGRGVVKRFTDISQAGVKAGIPGGFTWIITDNTDDWSRLLYGYLKPLGNKVIILEGANENMGTSGNTQAYAQIKSWWNNILPVLPNIKIASNTGPTAACEILTSEYIGNYVHYGNAHPYHFWPPFKPFGSTNHCGFNSTCAPPTISLWTAPDNNGGTIGYIEATRAKRVSSQQPLIFTEWGYPSIICSDNNWGVEPVVAAKYLLRGFLEHFNAGIEYSCSYELINEDVNSTKAELNFGLADYNGNLKQNGFALKQLIELLEDTGNSKIVTSKLNFTLSGGDGLSFIDDHNATTNEIHQTLVQKADSTFYLILWQEAISTNSAGQAVNVPAVNVTVNFNKIISKIKAYLPATTSNSKPVVDTVNIQTYTFSVPDHPLVIEITEKPGSIAVTDIKIEPDSVSINTEDIFQVKTSVLPSNASNKHVTYLSSNDEVATISYTGSITGISEGNAVIKAVSLFGNIEGLCKVNVKFVPVNSIRIDTTVKFLGVNEKLQLKVFFNPANATNRNVTWSSNDTNIVKVDTDGVVTGIKLGNADITAKSVSGEKTDLINIKVLDFVVIDDAQPGWTWAGFAYDPCATCLQGATHAINIKNSYAYRTFTGNSVEVFCESWSGGGNVEIFIDAVSKGVFSQNNTPFGGGQKFATIYNLKDTTHIIKIVAVNNNWSSVDYIKIYSLKPIQKAPEATQNITIKALAYNSIELKWLQTPEASKYVVWRKKGTGSWVDVMHITNALTTIFTDTNVLANTLYYYRIVASNETGEAPKSAIVSVTTPNNVNNIHNTNSEDILIYPNPTTNLVNIVFDNNVVNTQSILIEINDLTGKNVFKSNNIKFSNFQVNTSSFSKGVYIVKIITGFEMYTKMLIIN